MDEERLSWQEDGACRGSEPDVFFPVSDDDAWGAKQICRRCVVQTPCLVYALQNRERYGVWGGTTEKERAEMFRRGIARRVLAEAVALAAS
jgi:WhiB family redox-sensing transcriptional regulator